MRLFGVLVSVFRHRLLGFGTVKLLLAAIALVALWWRSRRLRVKVGHAAHGTPNSEDGDGDSLWWTTTTVTPLSLESDEVLWCATLLRQTCPTARLVQMCRVHNQRWWRNYCAMRDGDIANSSVDFDANEQLLFHGSGTTAVSEVLKHQDGIDPRFGNGGF